MQSIIRSHNKKILNPQDAARPSKLCNCQKSQLPCPLQGRCQLKDVVYKGHVSSVDGVKTYVGQTSKTFKDRYGKHKSSFKLQGYSTKTVMASYIWDLKEQKKEYEAGFSLMCESRHYRRGDRHCQLCNAEKTFIALQDENGLNKRSEILERCKHKDPHFLENWKTISH